MNPMQEICKHCNCTFGSHLAQAYNSEFYKRFFPSNYCPGHEGRMDWDKGPGTVFEPTGQYKKDKEVTSDNRKNFKAVEEGCA